MIAETGVDGAAKQETPSDVRRSPRRAEWRLIVGAWLVVEVVVALASIVRAVHTGKPETFDLANYEYYSGFAQLHGFRSAIALPGLLQTYLDAQLNTLYYLLMTHLHPREAVAAIAVLQSLPISVMAVLVWRLARGAGGSPRASAVAGLLAGAGAFAAPIYGIELGEAASDSLLALPLFVAAALLYRSLTASSDRRTGLPDVAIAGVLLGIAGALKFTMGPFVLAILLGFAVAVLVGRSRRRWSLRRCLVLIALPVVVAVVSGAAIYLPEGLLLWHRYHDPIFPFFNGIFHSPDLLRGNYRDQRWTAHSVRTFWLHYERLFIGGDNRHNGTSQWPVRSPVLFFAIAVTVVALVIELINRTKPEALFLEVSFVAGFALSEFVFGIYRYLAPIEMAAPALVISLVFVYRLRPAAVLAVLAVGIGLGSLFAVEARLGSAQLFGTSYFAVPPGAFSDLKGAGVVMAGPGPLGYLVPDLPSNTELVRAGGNLNEVMSPAWWSHAAATVRASRRPWWVVYQSGTDSAVPAALREVGFSGTFNNCTVVGTAVTAISVCRLPPPAR